MKYTIEDFKDRKISLKYEDKPGDLEKLRKIMNTIYPDRITPKGKSMYYYSLRQHTDWMSNDIPPSETHVVKVEDFYNMIFSPKKLIGYKLNGLVSAYQVAELLDCGSNDKDGLFFWDLHHPYTQNVIDKARKLGILDLWFDKVYEEEKKEKIFKLGSGKEVLITKEKFMCDDIFISTQTMKHLLNSLAYIGIYKVISTAFKIGCVEFTREELEQALEIQKSL